MAGDLLTASLSSASSLVLLQLFSRVFTFVLNQALIRLASPQVFGIASIQFELLLSTILFLSREGVRNALLRNSSPQKHLSQTDYNILVTNISLLPVLLGIPTAILSALIYIYTSSTSTSERHHFHSSVFTYALAAVFELLAEPLYIRAQNQLQLHLRVRAEGLAVTVKAITTFALLVLNSPQWALLAFATGQAAYGLVILATYRYAYRGDIKLWPRQVAVDINGNKKMMYYDPALLRLSGAMTLQSVVKHFLTEGDKFIVSRFSPLADQGGYAVASNYGSLVARIIFQPVEETSRVFFSKTLSATSFEDKGKPGDAVESAADVLTTLLLLYTHLFLLLVTFGPPYLRLAASILLPPRYLKTSAPRILHTYLYYIPMMAFNGVLEAFFASVSSPEDLRAQSRWMLGFSMTFIVSAVGLAKGAGLGDVGLVWANVGNLAVRAWYAWAFVGRLFGRAGRKELVAWRKASPPLRVWLVFLVAAGVTRWSEKTYHLRPMSLRGQIEHVAVGVVCVAACLGACYVYERRMFMTMFRSLRNRQSV